MVLIFYLPLFYSIVLTFDCHNSTSVSPGARVRIRTRAEPLETSSSISTSYVCMKRIL